LSNFIGELSKILFGTLDEEDAHYYNEQMKLFEQNSDDMNTTKTTTVRNEIIVRNC
jgi:hypothetical protein